MSYSDLCFRKMRLEVVWLLNNSPSLKTSAKGLSGLPCLYEDRRSTLELGLKSLCKVEFSPAVGTLAICKPQFPNTFLGPSKVGASTM